MRLITFVVLAMFVVATSCSLKYVTPGSSVKISELADEDISKLLSNKPTSVFPVNIAIARVQDRSYSNFRYRSEAQEAGANFSLILTRDAQEDEAFEKLSELNGIDQASPFNRLLLPYAYKSIKDLRLAAAKMKAGMLLVYTFDTDFIIDTKNYGPQNVLSLGYLKNKEVNVVTTASVALFDVQTEYLYGLAEATAKETRKSNAWKKQDEVDNLRIETERKAFAKLMGEIEKMWSGVVVEYSRK
ncbi:MAG: hypothetical protein H7Y42_17205 [Chitinophagaceae bacterium]|nr:hypothetical protein [Chitinophagaceae bacterium]